MSADELNAGVVRRQSGFAFFRGDSRFSSVNLGKQGESEDA